MSRIQIVDTSVFCNILGVPDRCQDQERALQELEEFRANGDTLLLPMAVVYETGNHIAHHGSGGERRIVATRFAEQVDKALSGESPFSPTRIHDAEEVKAWLADFPEYAVEGLGFGDRSIIEVWNQQCDLNPGRRTRIWAYDADLQGYDSGPDI